MATVKQVRQYPVLRLTQAHPGKWECLECGSHTNASHATDCSSS